VVTHLVQRIGPAHARGCATQCADPYHVVAWATEALHKQRRIAWNAARGAARGRSRNRRPTGVTKMLKNARWALWKNPEHLTERQREQLAWIAKTNPALHRAWALEEGLRTVFAIAKRSPIEAAEALDRWISWARRCPLAGLAMNRAAPPAARGWLTCGQSSANRIPCRVASRVT